MIPAEVIQALLKSGYAPTTLSISLGIPYEEVAKLMSDAERARHHPDDEMLRDAMRTVAARVVEETLFILDEGTPQMKLQLISRLGGQMATIFAKHEEDQLANLRSDFQSLMSEMRGGERGPDALGPATVDSD